MYKIESHVQRYPHFITFEDVHVVFRSLVISCTAESTPEVGPAHLVSTYHGGDYSPAKIKAQCTEV